ncbi:MAG: electron transport complex subunit RsxA [Ruminococcaceae bacterium]|nr:electron transport complex subunit RsxA [Oscillospiraceae bacterium]
MPALVAIALTSIFTQNFVLVKFYGICPFLGVSKKVDTALGMGMAVTFVMTLASIMTWLCQQFILIPLNIEYMQTIAFIVIIAALVQFVEMFLQKSIPSLYSALGIYLPLITTNCAVLGVALLNVRTASVISTAGSYTLIESIVNGFSAGIGFMLAIVLFAGVRERLENSDIPKALEGFPIALISASLLALAFLGFQGMSF